MEPRERMLVEIVAGVVLVTLLILASVMVISAYKSPETKITNSFNTYNYNSVPARTELVLAKPYIVDGGDYKDYSGDDNVRYVESNDRYLGYDDFGNFRTYMGIVGNRVDSYEVYVTNHDYVGGYFKTIFYFEDYYGNIDSESMTNYISAREGKRFVLKDVSPSRYDHRKWWYEVTSMTKAPERKYYSDSELYMGTYSSGSRTGNYFYIN